jgi:hypothetical protein
LRRSRAKSSHASQPGEELAESLSPLRLVISAGPAVNAGIAKALGIPAPGPAGAQSCSVRRAAQEGGDTIAVFGADAAGAMYGGLDVAEAIRFGRLEQLADADRAPYIEKRGIKFNAPLVVRIPSDSDNSDAAQANIPEMWSFDFWRKFLARWPSTGSMS